MDLIALSGAATIALASTILFVLIVKSWQAFAKSTGSTRFPHSIMFEAAQRFRDELARLSREQSVYLVSALVFSVIFVVTYLLPPVGMFDDVPTWQMIVVLVLLALAAGYATYRILRTVVATRRLGYIRDANMATGHALQNLTANRNRVFHDVSCHAGIIDNVIVGLHGIYTVSVIAKKAGKDNRVRLEGNQLHFAPGKVIVNVERAGKKSDQLAREIRKKIGHEVFVRSVIAVPGWEIESQRSGEYLVVNERNLAMLTGWKDKKDYLMNEDVEAVQQLLAERCTRARQK